MLYRILQVGRQAMAIAPVRQRRVEVRDERQIGSQPGIEVCGAEGEHVALAIEPGFPECGRVLVVASGRYADAGVEVNVAQGSGIGAEQRLAEHPRVVLDIVAPDRPVLLHCVADAMRPGEEIEESAPPRHDILQDGNQEAEDVPLRSHILDEVERRDGVGWYGRRHERQLECGGYHRANLEQRT